MENADILTRIMQSLNCPLYIRCADLAVLLDRCTFKDLQTIYPILIDNIFGPAGGLCWNLRGITNANLSEFNSLQNFFSPVGPFFKVIYKLLQDSKLKYEFPISYLPMKVRQSLEIHNIPPPFYNDLINVDLSARTVTSLSLNPFDYYFFHFAYYLTNPWQQRDCLTWNTVYYILCCDYLIHFLPINPDCLVYPELQNYSGKIPVVAVSPTKNRFAAELKSKLLLSSVFNQNTNEFTPQMADHHPRSEIWRSETVMVVFIDMWLNNDYLASQLANYPTLMQQFHYSALPSAEYIRIVRVLVKQLHSFSASAQNDLSYLGELKKIVLPMLQGRMYIFLRNLIHKWPLDGSFRLVLELWLSFIQPWRYSGTSNDIKLNSENTGMEDELPCSKYVDRENLPFISDNLLAYTVIFQHLLPRFSRTDLVSPKNSLMLYRVTKVFGQLNLISLLKEVESYVGDFNHSPIHAQANYNAMKNLKYQSSSNSTSCLNYNKYPNNGKWSSAVRQKMIELEGPEFSYKPLFSNPPGVEVYELLKVIKRSLEMARDMIKLQDENIKIKKTGIQGFFQVFFPNNECLADEFTLEDRKKVPIFLECSLQSLIEIFNINTEVLSECDSFENSKFSISSSFDCSNVTMNKTDISFLMSPQNLRTRLQSITYQGDPELQSIRSNECAVLVRFFYQLSSKLNQMYGDKIQQLYYSRNFIGKFSRQILIPPVKTFRFNKRAIGSPKVQRNLPPRISFRRFGSNNSLVLFIFAVMFLYFSNCNKLLFLGVVFMCWFVYNSIGAAFSQIVIEQL